MTDDQKSAADQAKLEKAPDKSINALKIAGDLARQELEFKQQSESKEAKTVIQKDTAIVLADLANKRADILVSTAPTQSKALLNFAQKTKIETASPKSTAPAAATETAPSPTPAKGFGDKLKDFFTSFSEKIKLFFAKIFNKKAPEETLASTTPTPTNSASPAQNGSQEKAPDGSKESWRAAVHSEAKRLGIEPAFAMAIVVVEAGKKGLDKNGMPLIRFEAHIFNQQLANRGVKEKHGGWGNSTLSGRNVDGVSCEGGQANEQACFQKAISINKDAAYNSISMGLGQIMGFNAASTGYSSAENMYNSFSASGGGEPEQIKGMFKFLENNKVHLNAARNNDFSTFARVYNGAKLGSAKHAQYTSALQNAYRSSGGNGGGNMAVA